MPQEFHKYHGLGNDLILVDARDGGAAWTREDWGKVAEAWCCRHTGIGADAILLMGPAESGESDLHLRIFNPDGGEVAMCGNGIRCVARYVAERGGVKGDMLRISTAARVVTTWPRMKNGVCEEVRVDMGAPVLEPARVPVSLPGERAVDVPLGEDLVQRWKGWAEGALLEWRVSCVSMGNPHAVVFCGNVAKVPLEEAGRALECHAWFPMRTNAHFAQAVGPREVRMRSWERGAGITAACGSGACATVVSGVLAGKLQRDVVVKVRFGELRVEWDKDSSRVFVTGPAAHVYTGTTALGA